MKIQYRRNSRAAVWLVSAMLCWGAYGRPLALSSFSLTSAAAGLLAAFALISAMIVEAFR